MKWRNGGENWREKGKAKKKEKNVFLKRENFGRGKMNYG